MFDSKKEISEDIFIYKNFLGYEECNEIVEYLDQLNESDWVLDRPGYSFYKRTERLDVISKVRDKIVSILPDALNLGVCASAVRMKKGAYWEIHSDVHDFFEIEKLANSYVEGQPYLEKELSVYGTVVYFNNFEGGEIYYPNQGIIYKPSPGDLVIHSSSDKCLHGVKPLVSEKRYSYANHIYKIVRIPDGS